MSSKAQDAVTKINKAQNENKEAVVESKVLHNRIVKMQTDIEKSQHRLKKMQQKQNFMEEMGKEKYERQMRLAKAKEEQKEKEELNRRKFSEKRKEANNKIAQTRQYMYLVNHVNHNEIKDQERRNKELIYVNKEEEIRMN